jgi:phosphoglycerate dehydrogenase-like enzyme
MNVLLATYTPVAAWNMPDAYVERLRRQFPEHTFVRANSDAETLARIPDADVAFGVRFTPDHLAVARQLRWIHSPAAGVGNLLFPEMISSPVVLTNNRGNSSGTIAEHVIAVTLALLRGLPLAWRRQAEGVWAQDEINAGPPMRTLRESRVLVVGLGAIGAAVARLATAFGAHVVGVRRRTGQPAPDGVGAVVGPDALADELPLADVVVVAAPDTSETVRLIGERELALMKDDAVLVNVSRGALIDETALVRTLETGRLRGAALDVFEREPLAAGSPLWARHDVLLTPHVAGFHKDHWDIVIGTFTENLRRFAAGEPLVNLVDKKAGY